MRLPLPAVGRAQPVTRTLSRPVKACNGLAYPSHDSGPCANPVKVSRGAGSAELSRYEAGFCGLCFGSARIGYAHPNNKYRTSEPVVAS